MARLNGLHGAGSQELPEHIGHAGSVLWTVTPYEHSEQRYSPFAFSPAAKNRT